MAATAGAEGDGDAGAPREAAQPLLSSELATAVTHLFPALHLVPAIEEAVDVDVAVPNPQELRSRATIVIPEASE